MALTPEGTPYVESTDLVANYPAASLSLANRVDLVGVLPFADSAARAAAIPTPTDGQFTYLQDTNSTEFYDGANFVPLGSSALTHINTSTFTAQNAIILNDIFSASYENYLLIHTITTTTGSGNLLMRMRASGTNNTSANYGFALNNVVYSNGAESNFASGATATSFTLVQSDSGEPAYAAVTFINPYQTYRTAINIHAAKDDRMQFGGGMMTVTTVYDGVEIYHSTSNMTGTVRVYGYKNS